MGQRTRLRNQSEESKMTFGALNRDENYFSVAEPLLPVESSAQLTQEAAVTTVTFFSGASTEAVADVARETVAFGAEIEPLDRGKSCERCEKVWEAVPIGFFSTRRCSR